MQTISKVKNGFKETEIGLIPEDWKAAKLKDILKEVDVRVKDLRGANSKELSILSLTKNFGLIQQSQRFHKRIAIEDISNYKVVKKWQIVYNPYVIWEGAISALRIMNMGVVSPVYCVWEIKNANPSFIDYLLRTPKLLNEYMRRVSGVVKRRMSISKSEFLDISIPIPPSLEQDRIAKTLDTIQQTIQQQDKIIEATKNLKKSLMHKLFTEGTRGEEQKETEIGLIPKSWCVSELGKVATQRKELVLPCQHSDLPYIGLEHIDSWNVSIIRFGRPDEVKSSKYKFYKNDILYGKLRPYLDKAALANFNGLCSTDIIVIKTSEKILPLFLVNLLHLHRFVNYATSTMTGVNHPRTSWTAISKFKLPLPSLHEQQEIANTLSLIDKKIEIEGKRKATLQQLFKTMLNKLMTGEIRVKDLDLGVTNVS
jgi:type I restriction enzyme S subunit